MAGFKANGVGGGVVVSIAGESGTTGTAGTYYALCLKDSYTLDDGYTERTVDLFTLCSAINSLSQTELAERVVSFDSTRIRVPTDANVEPLFIDIHKNKKKAYLKIVFTDGAATETYEYEGVIPKFVKTGNIGADADPQESPFTFKVNRIISEP